MSVNSKMTAIANATRALDGSTAALTLDGIASKLGVEKSNVAAALAAIGEKGVTVPSGSTSDALAALIASIEAGGGGIDNMKTVVGSFTLTQNSGTHTIAHNLGAIPVVGLLVMHNNYSNLSSTSILPFISGAFVNNIQMKARIAYSGGFWISSSMSENVDVTATSPDGYPFYNATETDIVVDAKKGGSAVFLSGKTYMYCLMA